MKVYIESNNGEMLEFEVGSGSTIFEFKKMLAEDEVSPYNLKKIRFWTKTIKSSSITK